ncbi:MAG: hypothetical protein R3B90_12970 [Planctomycetaceae bacterium]
MSDDVLEALSLRERIRDAERLSRELAGHLEQGLLPKLHEVRQITHSRMQGSADEVSDTGLRTRTEAVLQSHEYTLELSRKLERYLLSVERETHGIVTGSSEADVEANAGR